MRNYTPSLMFVLVLIMANTAAAASDTNPNEVASSDKKAEAATSWKQIANARIEKIRKGDFTLTLVDKDGKPVAADDITLRQTRSHFHFGTAINGHPFADNETERKYTDFIVKHFNTLVCENHMKWYANERKQGEITYEQADAFMKFAEQHDLAMRGHCLFWAKDKFTQKWVQALSDEELKKKMEQRLSEIVPRYKGRLIAWDVNNEMLHGNFYKKRLGDDIRAWMFKRAHELDPKTPLFLNDYGILANPRKTNAFIQQAQQLIKQGAPVGGFGVQEHGSQRIDTSDDGKGKGVKPQAMWESLDAMGKLNLPIHLTEISAKHENEKVRADAIDAIHRIGFAHPDVDAILVWGFWAGRHWLGHEAGLVNKDWTLNEAGKRLQHLLLKEWRTNTTAESNAKGELAFRGFYGTYEIELKDGRKAKVELTPEKKSAEARLAE